MGRAPHSPNLHTASIRPLPTLPPRTITLPPPCTITLPPELPLAAAALSTARSLLPACPQADYDAGSGTCVKDTFICATLVGQKRVLPAAEGETDQVGGRTQAAACGCSIYGPCTADGITKPQHWKLS